MTRRTAAAAAYGALVVAALAAPGLAFDAATARGGAARAQGIDLILVGVAVGVLYVSFLQRFLRGATPRAEQIDRWLSAVHGLVTLALAASLLPAVALHESVRLHARIVDAEWPVLAAWAGVLGLAVGLAEIVRRGSLRWLRAGRRDDEEQARPTGVRHVHEGGGG